MSFRKLFCFTLILSCSLVTFSSQARASDQLLLNGTAIHTSLQQDYYYAALFSESRSEDPQTLLWQENQRMEITILVDEWSKRRFTQHLSQAIAINNTADDQEHHAKDIATFNTLIKDYLIRGDRIVISKDIDQGTKISINGITLMASDSHGFFSLFLNTWLGSRPPSSVFKASILGQQTTVDSFMMTSYESLTASANRINDLKKWTKKAQPKKTKVAKSVAKKAKTSSPKKSVLTEIADNQSYSTTMESQPRYVNTAELLESSDIATTIASEAAPVDFDDNAITETALKKIVNPMAVNEPLEVNTSLLTLASNTENNDLANEAIDEVKQQKEDLLRFYRSSILTSTYKKIVYPSSAIDKNQQGKVILKVVVNREGKVKSVDLEKKSPFKLLNKAANKAVTKAHFPSVPPELEGNEFEFLLPIQFSLN
jgi:protein TonB